MAKLKSLIKNVSLTEAKRAHDCRFNTKHKICKGDTRLTVKEGRKTSNYCVSCATLFLDSSIRELQNIRSNIELKN